MIIFSTLAHVIAVYDIYKFQIGKEKNVYSGG